MLSSVATSVRQRSLDDLPFSFGADVISKFSSSLFETSYSKDLILHAERERAKKISLSGYEQRHRHKNISSSLQEKKKIKNSE